MAALSYHEPTLPTLLTLLSFVYLLQVARGIADAALSAGLLGEIAIGIIYGPVTRILPAEWQETFLVMGYVGLVLIVFEGGLTSRVSKLKRTLPLGTAIALVGVLLPIAFTFALFAALGYRHIEALSVGAALASTSLGTTFQVLASQPGEVGDSKAAGLLVSAALIDDIIALVLLSVLVSLSTSANGAADLGWVVGRPVLASVLLGTTSWAAGTLALRPLYRRVVEQPLLKLAGSEMERTYELVLFVGVGVLSALLSISYYVRSTMLLGAFLAGLVLSMLPSDDSPAFAELVFSTHVEPVQKYILTPLFFASIGLSIPFLDLWTGPVIWKGITFSVLMALGKVLAGAPILACEVLAMVRVDKKFEKERGVASEGAADNVEDFSAATAASPTPTQLLRDALFAGVLVGTALVARGEIGVLILQVARSASIDSASPLLTEEPYLVGIWAVALNTIAGPVAFSALVKRFGKAVAESPSWGVEALTGGRSNTVDVELDGQGSRAHRP